MRKSANSRPFDVPGTDCPVRVRTKICGITSVEDGLAAAAAGCDAVGLNFVPASPRYLSVEAARDIAEALPPLVARVGVFVDAVPADVERVLEAVPLDLLQFNGREDAASCARFGLPYLKAVGVRAGFCMASLEEAYPTARGFLLDTYDRVARGGTGRTFDWSLWPMSARRPLVLAGGLTPDNVGAAIRRLHPYAVDVSSGVEGGARGVKSDAKVRAFVAEVQRAALE